MPGTIAIFTSKPFPASLISLLWTLKIWRLCPLHGRADIQENPKAFLALSQGEISRIVTLNTSGTTADPKRIFFTDEDLGRVVDFFTAVLTTIMNPGETGLIFLPGDTRASAGDLIRTAMEAVQACPVVSGIIQDFGPAADLVRSRRPSLLVGNARPDFGLVRIYEIHRNFA